MNDPITLAADSGTDLPVDPEAACRKVTVARFGHDTLAASSDFVACEVPVAIVFNGISHAVMLASPVDLIDFALGFSFAEGIIENRADVYEIEVVNHPDLGCEVHLQIASENFARLKDRRRSLAGRTGCGLCGLDSLVAFEAGLTTSDLHSATTFAITQHDLFAAFRSLQQHQTINQKTGSMHAAAWVSGMGQVQLVREDLGRHNALDKLIGALLDQNLPATQGCIIMTSRASYELAQKAARAGVPLLATISAPTSLAIDLAQTAGLTLIGFVRHESLVAYSHAGRLQCV